MEANGFDRTAFHVVRLFARRAAGRPRSNEAAGSRNQLKTRPKMTRASTWPASAKIYVSEGVFVSKTPEITTFWGWGTQFFFGGGGEQDTPRQDRQTT